MLATPAHRRAIRYSQAGNSAHLAACLAVWREMSRNRTLALASDLARSVDTIERMGRAGMTYVSLRKMCGRDKLRLAILRDARCQLYYTHFEILGRYWFKYEFDIDTAMNYLSDTLEHRYSTRALAEALAADYRSVAPDPFHLGDFLSAELARSQAAHDAAQTDTEIEATQRAVEFFDTELSRASHDAEKVIINGM